METNQEKPQEKAMTAKEWLKTKPNYVQDYLWCTDGVAALLEEYTATLRTKLEAMEVENLKLKDEVEMLRQVDDHHPPGYYNRRDK